MSFIIKFYDFLCFFIAIDLPYVFQYILLDIDFPRLKLTRE